MTESKLTEKVRQPKIGLALGGGGALGGIYEIGALRALDEALEGIDFNDLQVYVGVNAGAFVAANLANQVTTAQMCRTFIKNEAEVHPFHPGVFYRPALREYMRRIFSVPGLLLEACAKFVGNPRDQSFLDALTVLAQAIPGGLFENEQVNSYLEKSFNLLGRTNDFRQLKRRLYLVASDVESGQSVRFGASGFDHVPISKAVQASVAAPALYMPVEIDGRYYLDGTLNKGMHASVALEDGADLVLAINPVVPVEVKSALAAGTMVPSTLIDQGMQNILSQTYRTMVHSRMRAGMAIYEREYPEAKITLFEPRRDDGKLFFSNVFSFQSRRVVCEHAYQMTRYDLLQRYETLSEELQPFGIRIRKDILEDSQRTISTGLYGEMLPLYVSHGAKDESNYLGKLGDKIEGVADMLQRLKHII